jgi:hypothetical protein
MTSPNAVTISTASQRNARLEQLAHRRPLKLMPVQCISRAPSPPHRGRELRARRPASCRIFVQSPSSSGASCASRRSHGKTRNSDNDTQRQRQRGRASAYSNIQETLSHIPVSRNPLAPIPQNPQHWLPAAMLSIGPVRRSAQSARRRRQPARRASLNHPFTEPSSTA